MNTLQKQQIAKVLTQLKTKHSQNKLAVRAGISPANVSNIINGKWDKISDELWQKAQANLGINLSGWQTAQTSQFAKLTKLIEVAQERSISIAVTGDAGAGKTHTYRTYERTHNNVVYLQCAFHFTQRTFIAELLRAMGRESAGLRLHEMIQLTVNTLKSMHRPVVILDEADKLKDTPFMLYIDLYNQLDGHAAFVLSGAPFLAIQIEKNAKRDKRGYREILSRIGRKFIQTQPATYQDIKAVCEANGLVGLSVQQYKQIHQESGGDLRRVKRIVEKYQELQKTAV